MKESWICLSILIPASDEEAMENFAPSFAFEQSIFALLYAYGVNTINVQDAQTLDGKELEALTKRLRAFFKAEELTLASELKATLEQEGRRYDLPISLELTAFSDDSWQDSWKEWFKPAQVSKRLAIRAPWVSFEAPDSVQVIVIEPGMAFGTGLHETTQLCLRELDHICEANPKASLLDVGCGSGVLAIAAAKLGLEDVEGVDNDPVAVDVSIENAEINHVKCSFSTVDINEIQRSYDIVVANIISSVLIDMRKELARCCNVSGKIVLSGILRAEKDEVLNAFSDDALGLAFVSSEDMGEWCSLVFEKVK